MTDIRGGPSCSKAAQSAGPLPNRWLHCPRKSESIIAEKFIAFKTPLSDAFTGQMPLECLFSPEMIFGYCKAVKLKLGLWIDLTNTKRFYDRSLVEQQGVQYVKLQCRGHGETPSVEQTRSFIEIVDNFINDNPIHIIGVHCTHGFNRTGFLIASYLVERLDCSVEAALSIFATARPPGIYKQDYINELFARYESEEDSLQAPEMPDWCHEYDDSNGDQNDGPLTHYAEASANGNGDSAEDTAAGQEAGAAEGNGAPAAKKRRRELVVRNPTFMEGVPGVDLVTDTDLITQVQQQVQQMCGWSKSGFPGSQPVSMDRNNIKRLHEMPYRVSWKADGMRYMMLIRGRDEIFFVDRNNSCFQVQNLSFPKAKDLENHLADTLIDGEMVLDKLNEQTIPRFLIYDIIKISNYNIAKRPFPDRSCCIKKEIIEPRYEAIECGIIDRASESFGVRHKEFWDIRQAASLLGEKFTKTLLHEPDGLIFQPAKEPYIAGVCPNVLKWKPSNMNSVDFRLKIVTESALGTLTHKVGNLYVSGYDMPFDKMKYTKELKKLDNKIVECCVNRQGQWEVMRERTDKTLPNSFNTAKAVIESIRYPVTRDYLLDFINNYGCRDDKDMMPPPAGRRPPPPHQQQQQPQQQEQQPQQH